VATSLTARVRRHILDVDLVLDLARAPVTVLFGPSGAGKTTLLRCIAGLDVPEQGSRVTLDDDVWFDGESLVPARHRRIGFLFQDHVLFPHLSVADNVGYGLGRVPRAVKRARVHEALEMTQAGHLLSTPVANLSGGEAQRVALARALAPDPRLLLLDEPLSALDAPTRAQLRGELRGLLRNSGVPAIVVTHDRAEALALGDAIAVVLSGRLRQLDTVENVFSRPAGTDVAAAVGTETTVAGHVVDSREGITYVDARGVRLAATSVASSPPGAVVLACIRAEDVALTVSAPDSASGTSPRNHLRAVVTALADHGPLVRVDLDVGFPLAAYVTHPTRHDLGLAPGMAVTAVIKAPSIHLIPRERPGEPDSFAVSGGAAAGPLRPRPRPPSG
jgi:molybdate transport system ATP-binding protein